MDREETIKLFNQKSDWLLGPESYYDFQEIYLADFLEYVFPGEPFEGTLSPEYLRWKNDNQKLQVERNHWKKDHPGQPFEKRIDYDGYPFFRYNPIAIEFTKKKRKDGSSIQIHTIITKDNQECLDRIEGKDFVIMSPITYVGRNRNAANARYLYAFVIDLDGVGMKQMVDVIWHMRNSTDEGKEKQQIAPVANIIVNSGHGLHLYYLLKKPVPLFKNNVEQLNKMKKELTDRVWNQYTSSIKEIQYQGIFQGFRLPGTHTKYGETIRAFYNNDSELFTLKELNDFLYHGLSDQEVYDMEKGHYNPNNVTLKEAERRWPEWYERVIVQKKDVKAWKIKRDLYDWWLRRLRDPKENVVQGHRYFCMMALAIYARKCEVPFEELKEDALSLVAPMDALTKEEDNHFSEDDAIDALQAYKADYVTFPKNSISYLTGLSMPENRRNGRNRKDHVRMMTLKKSMVADCIALVIFRCPSEPFDCLCGKVDADCTESLRLFEKGCFLVPLVFLHNSIKNKGMEYRKTYNSSNEIVRAGVSLSVRYPVPV